MISDERLAETIDELEPFNNLVQVVDGGNIKEFLIELQQHRAEKHERRWRKISEDMKVLTTPCQVSDGNETASFDWFEGQEEIVIKHIGMDAKWWRPQLTDLPRQDLPSLDDMVGCVKLPDGVTGDQYVRHLRDGTIDDLPEGE